MAWEWIPSDCRSITRERGGDQRQTCRAFMERDGAEQLQASTHEPERGEASTVAGGAFGSQRAAGSGLCVGSPRQRSRLPHAGRDRCLHSGVSGHRPGSLDAGLSRGGHTRSHRRRSRASPDHHHRQRAGVHQYHPRPMGTNQRGAALQESTWNTHGQSLHRKLQRTATRRMRRPVVDGINP